MLLLTSGKYCCLWCLIPQKKLIKPRTARNRFPDRNLTNISGDHQRFVDAGSVLADAKFFNNCITEHFFDIPIDNASSMNIPTYYHYFV